MPAAFEPIASGRKSAAVAQQLAGTISSGRLAPGERLPAEPQLAKEFDVSRGVVREAIRMLEAKGLLEVRRGYGGGTFVGPPAPAEYQPVERFTLDLEQIEAADLAQVFAELGPLAARLAAGGRYQDTAAELERQLDRAEAAAAFPGQWAAAIAGFQLLLAERSGNRLLHLLAEALRPALLTLLHPRARHAASREEVVAQLRVVTSAIAAGDAAVADQAMRDYAAGHGRAS